jgi:hypothetical protein
MDQVNIHFMLSAERMGEAMQLVEDVSKDSRTCLLNAIVFLQYKPKGSNTDLFSSVPSMEAYKELTKHCEALGVPYGFDSCSAPLYMASIEDDPLRDRKMQMVEPCESGLFSSYINVDGMFYVCSFAEGEDDWVEGIDVMQCETPADFLEQVWYNERLVEWRERLASNNRECPIYDLVNA